MELLSIVHLKAYGLKDIYILNVCPPRTLLSPGGARGSILSERGKCVSGRIFNLILDGKKTSDPPPWGTLCNPHAMVQVDSKVPEGKKCIFRTPSLPLNGLFIMHAAPLG